MLSQVLRSTYSRSSRLIPSFAHPTVRSYTSKNVGRNGEIVELLNSCMKEEDSKENRNGYKVRAFRLAMKAIEDLDQPILSSRDARKVRGIGEGIAGRIGAFLNGEEYVEPKPTPKAGTKHAQSVSLISLVPGIGEKKAIALVEAGCDTIVKLRTPEFRDKLTPIMKIGLDYFDFLGEHIDREQAGQVLEFCKTFLRVDSEILLVGSYRRGAEKLSELEFLIVGNSDIGPPESNQMPSHPPSHPKLSSRSFTPFYQAYATLKDRDMTPLINNVIDPLRDLGLLSEPSHSGAIKWRGWLRIPGRNGEDTVWENRQSRKEGLEAKIGTFIRVDFNYVPRRSKGAALLALTGDRDFFSDIQSRAAELGMYLNEYGLWSWDCANTSSKQEGRWELVEGREEVLILQELDMTYVRPDKRNFSFIKPSRGRKKTI